jgi:hypothetical protein
MFGGNPPMLDEINAALTAVDPSGNCTRTPSAVRLKKFRLVDASRDRSGLQHGFGSPQDQLRSSQRMAPAKIVDATSANSTR